VEKELGHLRDAIAQFQTAMLVTHDPELGMRARPLSIADYDDGGSLWFFTSSESGKVLEIEREAKVAVVMQEARRFVSISGRAKLDPSIERRRQLWRESFRPWFPKGPEGSDTTAIEVVPVVAELWDLHGKHGVEYVLHALSAVVQGKAADDDANGSYHVQVRDLSGLPKNAGG
jgi:general stress protein 26